MSDDLFAENSLMVLKVGGVSRVVVMMSIKTSTSYLYYFIPNPFNNHRTYNNIELSSLNLCTMCKNNLLETV